MGTVMDADIHQRIRRKTSALHERCKRAGKKAAELSNRSDALLRRSEVLLATSRALRKGWSRDRLLSTIPPG